MYQHPSHNHELTHQDKNWKESGRTQTNCINEEELSQTEAIDGDDKENSIDEIDRCCPAAAHPHMSHILIMGFVVFGLLISGTLWLTFIYNDESQYELVLLQVYKLTYVSPCV